MAIAAGCAYDGHLADIACEDDGDCEGDTYCEGGYCVATGPPLGEPDADGGDIGPDVPGEPDTPIEPDADADTVVICESTEVECDGQCVDPTNDDDHCGQCDNPCTTDDPDVTATCEEGACTFHCNEAGHDYCEISGETFLCVDITTDEHCGECNSACADGQFCDGTSCEDIPCDQEGTPFGGGLGTSDDPFTICSPTHLQNVADEVDAHFRMYDHIDLQGVEFETIGRGDSDDDWQNTFQGHFDGGGYEIRNLSIDQSSNRVALFGFVDEGAEVINVVLVDVDIEGEDQVGGLAGRNLGTISDCEISGQVSGDDEVGGAVGLNAGTIEDCSVKEGTSITGDDHVGGLVGELSSGEVSGASVDAQVTASGWRIGGVVGRQEGGRIENSSFAGEVRTDGTWSVGGIVGRVAPGGEVLDSHAAGTVHGISGVGGIIGVLHGMASDCEAHVTVKGVEEVGGLVGRLRGEMHDSSAYGDVSGSDDMIGGAVGDNEGVVSGSSAHGDVDGEGAAIGGFVGYNEGTITGSSAHGDVTTEGSEAVGGFVGDHNESGTIEQCFADGGVETTTSDRVGGFVGINRRGAEIIDSYSLGRVDATDGEYLGGFMGLNSSQGNGGSVYTSYTNGEIVTSGSVDNVRGFGYNNFETVENCYWNSDDTDVIDNHSTGLTNEQFSQQESFAGFDFDDEEIWEMSPPEGRPILKWENQ